MMEPSATGFESPLLPDRVDDMVFDRERNLWFESPGPEADPFADIPDLSESDINEQVPQYSSKMQAHRPAKSGAYVLDDILDLEVDEVKERDLRNLLIYGNQIQDIKLAKWVERPEDDIEPSWTEEVHQENRSRRIEPIGTEKRPAPRPPRPRVGDILVVVHNFTARASDELTLVKGDEIVVAEKDDQVDSHWNNGWYLGKLLSTGDSGLFPESYTHVKLPRALVLSEGHLGVQKDLHAQNSDAKQDLGFDNMRQIGPHTSAGPVCDNCGARWNSETGCSRSCRETQDGFSVRRSGQASSASSARDGDGQDDETMVVGHKLPESVYSESNSESPSETTGSNATHSAIFSEKSREQPTDPSSRFDLSLADRAGARGQSADATLGGTEGELDADQDDEDCSRSVSSVADSIGSAVSTGGSLGRAGVNYVVAKFTQSDPELLALYTEASQRLTKDRFVENNRRLLKKFYLDFAREEQTPSQREAVAFLRSRRRRAEISWDIFRTVTPDYDAILPAEQHRRGFSMLNAYFETLGAADETQPAPECLESLAAEAEAADEEVGDGQNMSASDGSEVGDDAYQLSLDMTSLQAIGEYFVTSRAFSQYKTRLRQFLHPDHEKQDGMAGLRDRHHDREQHAEDASRALKPSSSRLVDNGLKDSLDKQIEGTRNQAEGYLAGYREADTRGNMTPENSREPFSRSPQTSGHRMPWERDSFATWVTKWLTDTLRPPPKGSQRMWYLCGCGEHTYMDVRELEPGGAESEWRSISESSAATTRACSPQRDASSGDELPAIPSPVHLGPTSSRNTEAPNLPFQDASHTLQQDVDPATATSPGPLGTTTQAPLCLLICINGKAYKSLAELRCLDIDDSYNDELLIRGILDQYEQARKGCQWTIDLLFPTCLLPDSLANHLENFWKNVPISIRRPSFIRESFLAQSISEWWSRWALDVNPWAPLHIIDTADFVEFELVPHPEGKEAFPSHFTPGCWPAPDNRQYRYRPIPMKCAKTMNLWHMRRPGPHTEVYWYNTVPKKVDGALYRPSGAAEDVMGYGVRINERLNDVLVLWWSFIFILATGVLIYVYSRYTGDSSSAFGLGAYLVAAFTVYIQLQYAWWKRS